ncbi:hypothetical protein EYC80_005628 [Monilinia laxa]|uniref:Alcohol acetyltransferase n=1 Tax=Monilinia laxa TaxID=61186 RepID=A0A5N6KER9_MONLA|nr:hypothetical protein EYC80_005628 [Monilinia laxa]
MEDDTFPAGLLGTYYSSRHDHGLYRSCGVSSHYTFTPSTSNPLEEFTQHLSRALAKTIKRHPPLCYGLLPASKPSGLPARFKRLPQISWKDIISITHSSEPPTPSTQETRISEEIGLAHSQLFDDPEHKPIWRLRVLIFRAENGVCSIYILFITHHAIADGLSCASFQRTLHEQLCLAAAKTDEQSSVSWPYIVPEDVGRPIAIEDAMVIRPAGCKVFALSGAPEDAQGGKLWAGNPPCMPTIASYRSLALLVTVPAERVRGIVDMSRRLGITVTGYLHGLVVGFLARAAVTDHQLSIKAGTPYSLRPFSKLPISEMANHVSSLTTEWDAALLARMRDVEEGSPEEEELLSAIGKRFSTELSTELANIHDDGVGLLRVVENIPDLDVYCREGLLRERAETYEISNLGMVRMNAVPAQTAFKLEALIFSQCGMVTGAPIGCSVVNVEGGPLVITLAWQEGGVADEIMVGLQGFLRGRLGGWSTG